jgi:hypothetical protein
MVNKIPYISIMQDMLEWSKHHSDTLYANKVMRVYVKCLRTGREKLAAKIAAKHAAILRSMRDDRVMALAYALFASKAK